jgi:hypothetical protein
MLTAIVAIALGALRLFALTALGRALLRRRRAPWLTVPLALLAGGAALGAMYAALLWAGWRDTALVVDGIAMVLAVAFRGRQTAIELRRLFAPLIELARRNRWTLAISVAVAAIYLFNAVMPPRETDALRYHLAHLAQIDREGRWAAMSITHYAFPFAWQTTFLPFVHFHLPSAAQVVDTGVWAVVIAAVVAQRGAARIGMTGFLLLTLVALAPIAIGTATTPTADVFTVLAALVVAMLLAGHTPDASGAGFGEATALGFAAWVAVGTRYQAVAIGIAATVVAIFWLARSDRWITLLGFVEGAVLAWLLAAPYFLANTVRFGNAFWPLRSTPSNADYTATVGAFYARSWHGTLAVPHVAAAAGRLLGDRLAMPVPLLLAVVLVAIPLADGPGARSARRVALFCVLFLVVWVLAQPMLYPRFSIYLIGPVMLLALGETEMLERHALRLGARVVLGASALALGAYSVAGVALDVRTLARGGRAGIEATTWYHSAYAWINENTPRDARMLVIVRSGETFYLDRSYRRADPGTSAEIEWPRIHDGQALVRTLQASGFGYVVFDSTAWGAFPGGDAMASAIGDASRRGMLTEVQRLPLQLTRSRFREAAIPATVIVYRVPTADGQPARR